MARRPVTSPAAVRPRAIFRPPTSPSASDDDIKRLPQDGTLGARLGQVLRFGGVLVLLFTIVLAALSFDEYERAVDRLKRPFEEETVEQLKHPFEEPNSEDSWGRKSYVEYRRDEAMRDFRRWAIVGGAGTAALLAGFADKWRRRRRRVR